MTRRVQSILNVVAATVDTTADQLFAAAHEERTEVTITNTGTILGQYIYIWYTNSVSSTIWEERLDATDSRSLYIGPETEVWIVGSVSSVNYTASEKGS